MDLHSFVERSLTDTKASIWPWFAPESILSVAILVILLARLPRVTRWVEPFWFALVGSIVALIYAVSNSVPAPGELFTGMLVMDNFTVFIRAIVITFVVLFVTLSRLMRVVHPDDSAEYYCLAFGAAIGMCLMASANHLLMVFLAVEMASIPSYALAASVKGNRPASEAGLKYAVYGAGAAGIMLYGLSLLCGLTGSAHLPTIAARLADQLPVMAGPEKMVLVLAGLMILVGVAFKLSAFPFHFWCPDVFEGASAEVDAFLSVASKAAALALLVRLSLGIGVPTHRPQAPPEPPPVHVAEIADLQTTWVTHEEVDAAHGSGNSGTSAADALAPTRTFLAYVIAILAAITCTFGNLAAYGQTNIKRLMAYSTIAHAGYMMLPIPVALLLWNVNTAEATRAVASLGIYMGVYLFMNLAAFAIVAFLRNSLGSEEIADYAGLVHRSPVLVICMALAMFSLVGIPPLAGFVGKFAIFASLASGYLIAGQPILLILLLIGGINTAISLFYYLRVVKVMAIESEPAELRPMQESMVSMGGAYIVAVTVPLLLLFVYWGALNDWATQAASQLF